jgi:hypothetical protein
VRVSTERYGAFVDARAGIVRKLRSNRVLFWKNDQTRLFNFQRIDVRHLPEQQQQSNRQEDATFPPVSRQAWNLTRALAQFVSDGCKLVTEDQYRQRLETCDTCDQRRGGRCRKCGCRLRLKARGRAFKCLLGKWPKV